MFLLYPSISFLLYPSPGTWRLWMVARESTLYKHCWVEIDSTVGVPLSFGVALFNFPERSRIFRQPKSWNEPTGISQSPGPEHVCYKRLNWTGIRKLYNLPKEFIFPLLSNGSGLPDKEQDLGIRDMAFRSLFGEQKPPFCSVRPFPARDTATRSTYRWDLDLCTCQIWVRVSSIVWICVERRLQEHSLLIRVCVCACECVSQCVHVPNHARLPLRGTVTGVLAPPRVLLGSLLPNAMETHRSFCNTNSKLIHLSRGADNDFAPADKTHASKSVCARKSVSGENLWSISLTTQKTNSRRCLYPYTQHTHMPVVIRAPSLRMPAREDSPRECSPKS